MVFVCRHNFLWPANIMDKLGLFALAGVTSPPVELTRKTQKQIFTCTLSTPLPPQLLIFSQGQWPQTRKGNVTLDGKNIGIMQEDTKCFTWDTESLQSRPAKEKVLIEVRMKGIKPIPEEKKATDTKKPGRKSQKQKNLQSDEKSLNRKSEKRSKSLGRISESHIQTCEPILGKSEPDKILSDSSSQKALHHPEGNKSGRKNDSLPLAATGRRKSAPTALEMKKTRQTQLNFAGTKKVLSTDTKACQASKVSTRNVDSRVDEVNMDSLETGKPNSESDYKQQTKTGKPDSESDCKQQTKTGKPVSVLGCKQPTKSKTGKPDSESDCKQQTKTGKPISVLGCKQPTKKGKPDSESDCKQQTKTGKPVSVSDCKQQMKTGKPVSVSGCKQQTKTVTGKLKSELGCMQQTKTCRPVSVSGCKQQNKAGKSESELGSMQQTKTGKSESELSSIQQTKIKHMDVQDDMLYKMQILNESTPQMADMPSPLPRKPTKQKKRPCSDRDKTPEGPTPKKCKTRMRALNNEFGLPKNSRAKTALGDSSTSENITPVKNMQAKSWNEGRVTRCIDLSARAPRPSARWGHSMLLAQSRCAVLIGGQGDRQHLSRDSVWTLHTETRKWRCQEIQSEGQKPENRMGHTATYDPTMRCIYIFGGSKHSRWFHDVHMYDLEENKWILTKVNGKAPTRAYHTAILHRHELWIFGGVYPRPDPNPDGCSNEIHIFSPVMQNWYSPVVQGEKPLPRSGHSATLIDDHMVMFGGWDAPFCYNDLFILDMTTVDWSKPDVKGAPPKPRSWHASCALSNRRILIHGGYDGNDALVDAFIFDLGAMSWSKLLFPTAPKARAGHAAVCLPYRYENREEDEILVFGGGDNDGEFFYDLLSFSVPFNPLVEIN